MLIPVTWVGKSYVFVAGGQLAPMCKTADLAVIAIILVIAMLWRNGNN
jgi:hypothetical protein